MRLVGVQGQLLLLQLQILSQPMGCPFLLLFGQQNSLLALQQ